jgi:hypothetical protein
MVNCNTQWNRLETVFRGEIADKTPLIGGWIACPQHICKLTGVSEEQYWANPAEISAKAYQILGMDGLIDLYVPKNRNDFRFIDANTYLKADTGDSLEEVLENIDAMPSAEIIEKSFDFELEYDKFRQHLMSVQSICGDVIFMPAKWGAGAKIDWYAELGYENFFIIVGLYPDYARKLIEMGGAKGRCASKLIARAVTEGIYPHAVLLGEDICTQRGPMISPEFLEKYYAPQLKYGLEPLLEVGCKPVWHCDGDVRPILDMVIDCGVKGLQGFQPECGLNIEYVAQRRTKEGKPLLIFGPMAVTTELPVYTPQEIKQKVKHAIEVCKGNADLALFTSNTINPDVPLENIIAMYEATYE